MAHKQQLTQ
jgi:predicted RNase H-like nuclease (RuvC/YqgF family)